MRLSGTSALAVRNRIRASELVNVLESHAIDGVEMEATRITAAVALLRKVIPDLAQTQLQVEAGATLIEALKQINRQHKAVIEAPRVSLPPLSLVERVGDTGSTDAVA